MVVTDTATTFLGHYCATALTGHLDAAGRSWSVTEAPRTGRGRRYYTLNVGAQEVMFADREDGHGIHADGDTVCLCVSLAEILPVLGELRDAVDKLDGCLQHGDLETRFYKSGLPGQCLITVPGFAAAEELLRRPEVAAAARSYAEHLIAARPTCVHRRHHSPTLVQRALGAAAHAA